MKTRAFGPLGTVSALTLGGGGLGRVWGPTNRAEAVATVAEAVAQGITLIDVAPGYETIDAPREAERVVGEAFGGTLPIGVRILTKIAVEDSPAEQIHRTIRESVETSLDVMQ